MGSDASHLDIGGRMGGMFGINPRDEATLLALSVMPVGGLVFVVVLYVWLWLSV